MSITLTYNFANEAELQQHLNARAGAAAPTATDKKAAAPAPTPAAEKKAAAPAPAPATKSERTKEEMVAALNEVKDANGKDSNVARAKAIIKDVAGVTKMAEIPEDKYDAVYDACKKALEEDGGM